ncbi:MAG: hypothetical protein Q8P67_08410, partial [archaeon]|nr:hypothetical protein [archaeon]
MSHLGPEDQLMAKPHALPSPRDLLALSEGSPASPPMTVAMSSAPSPPMACLPTGPFVLSVPSASTSSQYDLSSPPRSSRSRQDSEPKRGKRHCGGSQIPAEMPLSSSRSSLHVPIGIRSSSNGDGLLCDDAPEPLPTLALASIISHVLQPIYEREGCDSLIASCLQAIFGSYVRGELRASSVRSVATPLLAKCLMPPSALPQSVLPEIMIKTLDQASLVCQQALDILDPHFISATAHSPSSPSS